jgi:hypothetical protein
MSTWLCTRNPHFSQTSSRVDRKSLLFLVVSTDLLATVAATQDVVESTGKLNANFSAAFSLHVQFTLLVRLSARLQGRTRFGKATAIPSREPDRRR